MNKGVGVSAPGEGGEGHETIMQMNMLLTLLSVKWMETVGS